jgi:hypothetical protein
MRRFSDNSFIKMVVLAVLVVPLSAVAQSSCPLLPVQVKDTDSQLAIAFTNVSGKPVDNYRFALTFFDHKGLAHAFPQTLAGNVQIGSNSRRVAVWQTRLALHFLFPYVQAVLQQATFADGTSWVDDGSHSCSVMSVQE